MYLFDKDSGAFGKREYSGRVVNEIGMAEAFSEAISEADEDEVIYRNAPPADSNRNPWSGLWLGRYEFGYARYSECR